MCVPQVTHPNCVQLFEIFETPKKLHMVLELLTGGELFDRIVKKGSYSEKEASEVIRSVVSALQYLHEQGIVHRLVTRHVRVDIVACELPCPVSHLLLCAAPFLSPVI